MTLAEPDRGVPEECAFFMILILDCQACEAESVEKALRRIEIEATVDGSVDGIEHAARIILPPSRCLERTLADLRDRGLVPPLLEAVDRGSAVLGISEGLHLLFDVAYDEVQCTGLGLIPGSVKRFDLKTHPAARQFSLPHQGWNQVRWATPCPLFAGLESGESFYFNHACHTDPLDPRMIAATANYGIDFPAVVARGRIFGVQFLPQESEAGGTLLRNFALL